MFRLLVIVPTGLLVGFLLVSRETAFSVPRVHFEDAAFWTLLVAAVELLPVPAWKSVQLSIGGPLFMAVAFIYRPEVAGLIAFLGASDPREFRREVSPLHALFNRGQIALSTFVASLVFHLLDGTSLSWPSLIPATILAVLADYVVNVSLVGIDASLMHGVAVRTVLRNLRIGNALEFIASYVGLGFLGVLLARIYQVGEVWAVAVFVLPLLFVRQMFFRTRALEQATKELQDREVVLRALSNRMAEERHDERMQIAGYLHDDLAQVLFRMSLHVDMLNRQLQAGDVEAAHEELASISQARERTSQLIRALIKDLRQSPLGRAGLAEALSSFCAEVDMDWPVAVTHDLHDVDMPAPVQLLCYQVVREAVMNAAKHADATEIHVELEGTPEGARVRVRDNGKGFDPDEGSPEGHFGLTLMRERAQVAGGTFGIESAPGNGTTITAEFPTSWLVDADAPAARSARSAQP